VGECSMPVTSEAFFVQSRVRWWTQAACRGVDVDLFFKPDKHEAFDKAERRRREGAAKALCRSCPVTASCLAEAIRVGDRYGIRAGLTPEERRGLGLHRVLR
jgi:WhiB family redox-sensing transcriptional regulator